MRSSSDLALASLPVPDVRVETGDEFWRTDDPILREDRTIAKGGLFPHQRELIELPNFIKVLVMGYGGGKSLLIGKRAIAAALHNAPVAAAIIYCGGR